MDALDPSKKPVVLPEGFTGFVEASQGESPLYLAAQYATIMSVEDPRLLTQMRARAAALRVENLEDPWLDRTTED